MTTIERKTVVEKYDEISRLETFDERREFFGKQSEEMRVALWFENIDRKTKGVELTAKQKEILDVIKRKFITLEFAASVRNKSEDGAPLEYQEIMNNASQLFGKDNLRDWFVILGESSTLKQDGFCRLK